MKKKLSALMANSFIVGGVYLTFSNFLFGFLNYIFNIFSARLLGPEGLGEINALFAYIILFTIPLAAIGTVIVQRIGEAQENDIAYAHALQHWVFKKLKSLWIPLILLFALTPLMPQITNLQPIVAYSLIPIIVLNIFTSLYEGSLLGLHLFFWYSMLGLVMALVKLLGLGVGWISPMPMLAIMMGINLSYLAKILLSRWALMKKIKVQKNLEKITIDKSLWQVASNKQVVITLTSVLALSLLSSVDMIFAKRMLSSEQAGLYAAWTLFARIITYVFSPIVSLSYIFFTNKKQEHYHHIVLTLSLIGLTILGFGLHLLFGFFDQQLINLFFGDKFLSLKPFVEWSALFGVGYVMVMVMNYYFLAYKSKATLILPITLVIYIGSLAWFVKQLSDLVLVNTLFIIGVLALYLIAFFRERFVRLYKALRED